MSYDIKYEHINNMVVFANDVSISKMDYDALSRLKSFATCEPSFIWTELLRLQENQDTLEINFFKATFKRKLKALETLRDSKHFEMETREVLIRNKVKIQLKLTNITSDFKSIIPMI